MVDFTLSPGIVTTETDRSILPDLVALRSVGGAIGTFDWGPAMNPTLIYNVTELIDSFGKPTSNNYVEWFNCYNFLQYADTLNLVRIIDTATAKNASFSGTVTLISNEDEYMESLIIEEGGLRDVTAGGTLPKFGSDSQYGPWIAKFPGDLGNSLSVDMCFANAPARTISMNAGVLPADYINYVEFTKNVGYDNRFTVAFANFAGGIPTYTVSPIMGSAPSVFEDSSDVTTSNQSKVVTITFGGSNYDMLIESINPDGTLTAYVNLNGSGDVVDGTILDFHSTASYLTSFAVKERSKYREHSTGAVVNSPSNLLGRVYFDNNTNVIYGDNTVFTKQISLGDVLIIKSQRLSVTEIVDDTTLKTETRIIGKADSLAPVTWSREWKYATSFTSAPKTSTNARIVNKNLTGDFNDQLHIVVVDTGGIASGTVNQVLETYAFLSVAKDGRDDFGASTYYPSRVNGTSDWIKWAAHPLNYASMTNNWGQKTEGTVFTTYHQVNTGGIDYSVARFTNGSGGAAIGDDDITEAIQTFASKENVDVDLFLTGWTYRPDNPLDWRLAISQMIQLSENRQDCVVCVSGDYGQIARGYSKEEDIANRFIDWREGIFSSSYAFMDGNFKYQYDSYNDTYRWLPLSGDIAGLMAQVDTNYEPWYSPAGYTRGQIRNVVKLAYNPSQSVRDMLYENQINPVVNIRGEGTLLFGDKTMQSYASAFDRINVRRLFITMKDFVVVQARAKLFEFNTPATRADFSRICSLYLDSVVAGQGASEYRVICDETNNTAEIIERNRFVADIYVRPNYVINFIKLNFTAVGQSVSFADLGV